MHGHSWKKGVGPRAHCFGEYRYPFDIHEVIYLYCNPTSLLVRQSGLLDAALITRMFWPPFVWAVGVIHLAVTDPDPSDLEKENFKIENNLKP